MSTFTVIMQVGDPAGANYQPVEALVDTGASYTTLPASLLRSLDVKADSQRLFTLATGATGTRDISQTWIRLEGQTRMTIVVFGDEGARALLGAVTLEECGLGVDPVAKKLIAVPGLLT
jgi:predicted aspartyl protease